MAQYIASVISCLVLFCLQTAHSADKIQPKKQHRTIAHHSASSSKPWLVGTARDSRISRKFAMSSVTHHGKITIAASPHPSKPMSPPKTLPATDSKEPGSSSSASSSSASASSSHLSRSLISSDKDTQTNALITPEQDELRSIKQMIDTLYTELNKIKDHVSLQEQELAARFSDQSHNNESIHSRIEQLAAAHAQLATITSYSTHHGD